MVDTDDSVTEEPAGLLSRWSRNKSRSRSRELTEDAGADAGPAEIESAKTNRSANVQTEHLIGSDKSLKTPDQKASDHAGTNAEAIEQLEPDEAENELILTDDDMPPLETLHANSDYSGFFNKGVSPELKRKALQHLFRMPKFNIRDGLNDYDEDYTQFEPLGDTVTSDMRWHAARKEREEREAREAEEALIAENAEVQSVEQEIADGAETDSLQGDSEQPEFRQHDSSADESPGDDEPEAAIVDSISENQSARETSESATASDESETSVEANNELLT